MNYPPRQPSSAASADMAGRIARLMFYIVLSAVLMTMDFRGDYTEKLRWLAGLVLEPAVLAVEAPFSLAGRLREDFRDRRALNVRLETLESELRESRARLVRLDEMTRENLELRELLDASRALEVDFRTVELRSIDLNPFSHRVMVNRGRGHGLEPGQPVIDMDGVVGQVDEVLLHSARVVLISDRDHALPVRVRRTDLRTIAYGSGRTGELQLTDLPMNVDLIPDDELVTSGLGGRFPPGLPVATVESIERPTGEAFATAVARPLARLEGVRHLLVLMAEFPEGGEGQPDEVANDQAPANETSIVEALTEAPEEPDQPEAAP